MPGSIEPQAPSILSNADLKLRGRVYASPAQWRDQIFYFILPDRFSDGGEGSRPAFDRGVPGQYKVSNKATWITEGKRFQGGKIKGVQTKLDYLQEL
jgi:hypothetical protein